TAPRCGRWAPNGTGRATTAGRSPTTTSRSPRYRCCPPPTTSPVRSRPWPARRPRRRTDARHCGTADTRQNRQVAERHKVGGESNRLEDRTYFERRAFPRSADRQPDGWSQSLWPLSQRQWTPWSVLDRKSTRLNSSHVKISYAVFCLKKKT